MKRRTCRHIAFAIVLLFAVTLLCSRFPARVSSAEALPYNQVFQRDFVSSVDGVSLPCSIYIPPYGVSQYMPVWVDLHAIGGPGGVRWDWQDWARQRGWMIISPWGRNFKGLWADGLEPAGTTKEPCIYDDFATGVAGWVPGNGNWAQNTTGQCYQQSATSETWKTAVRGSSTGADYSVSVDINELASGAGISAAGIVFRRQANGDCYWLDLVSSGETRQLRLLKFEGGTWTELAVDDLGSSFDLRVKHNMKLMTFGDFMEVRLDGKVHELDPQYKYHQDKSEFPGRHDSTFTSGDVGLVSYGGSHQFDNFRVQNEFLYGQKDLIDTIEQFSEEFSSDVSYRADPSRVYLSGLSVGGTGAWNLGLQYPDMFSAMHPSVGATDMFEEYQWMDTQLPEKVFNANGTPPRFYNEQDFLYNDITEEILGGRPGSATEINSRMHEFSARYILENALNMPLRIEHPAYDTIFPNNNGPMVVWWKSMDGLITATRQATTQYAHSQYPWNKWKTISDLTNTRKETAMYAENGDLPSDPNNIWDNARYDTYFQGGGHGCCYYDLLMAGRHVKFFDRALGDLGDTHVDPDEVAYKTYDDVRNKAWWLTVDIASPNQDRPGLARVKRDRANNAVQVHAKNVRTTVLDLKRMGMATDPGTRLTIDVDNKTIESEPLVDTSNATDIKLTGEWDTAAVYTVKVNSAAASFDLTPGSMTVHSVLTEPKSVVLVDFPQTQGNMLPGGAFEQGAGDWTTSVSGGGEAQFEVANRKPDAHSGVGSVRIKDAAAAGAPFIASYVSKPAGVVPGRRYTAGAFVKTRALRAKNRVYENGKYSVDEKYNARARIGITWLDGNGSLLSGSESGSASLTDTNDWKPLEVQAFAPVNAAYAQVILKTESPDAGGNAGSAWFDDASLRRGYLVSGSIPALSGVTPNSAVNNGVAGVKLVGSGFASGATARLRNGQAVISATDVTVATDQITCKFNVAGAAVGDWDVEVGNANGERAILPGGFKVNPPTGPLTVTAISPGSGTAGGTVPVTVAGTGFQQDASVRLEANGVATIVAKNVSVSSTSSIASNLDLASAQAVVYDVVVTNPDAQTARKTGAFTVNATAPACGTGGASGILMFGLAMGFLAIAGLGPAKNRLRGLGCDLLTFYDHLETWRAKGHKVRDASELRTETFIDHILDAKANKK